MIEKTNERSTITPPIPATRGLPSFLLKSFQEIFCKCIRRIKKGNEKYATMNAAKKTGRNPQSITSPILAHSNEIMALSKSPVRAPIKGSGASLESGRILIHYIGFWNGNTFIYRLHGRKGRVPLSCYGWLKPPNSHTAIIGIKRGKNIL